MIIKKSNLIKSNRCGWIWHTSCKLWPSSRSDDGNLNQFIEARWKEGGSISCRESNSVCYLGDDARAKADSLLKKIQVSKLITKCCVIYRIAYGKGVLWYREQLGRSVITGEKNDVVHTWSRTEITVDIRLAYTSLRYFPSFIVFSCMTPSLLLNPTTVL